MAGMMNLHDANRPRHAWTLGAAFLFFWFWVSPQFQHNDANLVAWICHFIPQK